MIFKGLSMSEASKKMEVWKKDSNAYLSEMLDDDYKELRTVLVEKFNKIDAGRKYSIDCYFGMVLYLVLKDYGFTVRDAANDDKWRYLSLCVVPDLVGKRWGKMAEIRYYKQSLRIWLRTIWWYIYLSMQSSVEETMEVLKNNSTDQILNLVDRIGRKGYFVDTYRTIMRYFYKAKVIDSTVSDSEFRRIMTLHTAICKNIDPLLYPEGTDAYVKMIFAKAGVITGD